MFLEEFRRAFFDFCRRDVFDVGAEKPAVAGGILHTRGSAENGRSIGGRIREGDGMRVRG